MKVVGILSWYMEDPVMLMAAITSMAPALDHLVALDGTYALYPGGLTHPTSPIEQAHAVVEACRAVNLPLTLNIPNEVYFNNEVEKRNHSFDLARTVSTNDDWYLVFDGDETAHKIDSDFKHQLENTTALVATYGLWVGASFDTIRALYKAIPNLRYELAHYVICGEYNGVKTYLWGQPQMHQPYAPEFDASDYIQLNHRHNERKLERNQAVKKYYDLRDSTGAEKLIKYYSEGLDGKMIELGRKKKPTQDGVQPPVW